MSAAASTSENGDSVENQTCINRSRDTSVATPEQLQGAPTSPSRTFGSALPGVLLRQPIEVVPARNLSVIEPKLEGGIIPLHIDDTSAFRLTKNFESHAGTRHIDIRHHYIRSSTQSRHSALQPQRSRQSTHSLLRSIRTQSRDGTPSWSWEVLTAQSLAEIAASDFMLECRHPQQHSDSRPPVIIAIYNEHLTNIATTPAAQVVHPAVQTGPALH
jgi:hypothetical protein